MTQNSEIEMVKTNLSKVVKTEIGKVEYQTLEDKFVVAKVWSEDHEVSGWADDLKVTKKDKPCETYLKDYDVLKEGRYFIAHKNEWAFLNVPINQVRNTDVAVKSSKQGLELILSKENPSEEGKISKKYKIGKEELFEFGQKVFTFSVKDISESRYEQRIFSNNDYYPPVRVSSGEDLERYLSVAVYSDNLLVYSGDLKIEKEIGFSLMSAADSVEENDQTNHHLAGAMQGLAKKMEEKGVFYVPKRDSISLKEVRENSSSSIYSGPISSRERDTGFEEIDKSYLPVIKKEMSHLVDTFNEVVR